MQMVIVALVAVAVLSSAVAVFGYGHERSGPWRLLGCLAAVGAMASGFVGYKLHAEALGLGLALISAMAGVVAALLGHTGQHLRTASHMGRMKP